MPSRPAQVKIQSSALFVARVNESERSRNEKRTISLVFALVTNKAEAWIFLPVLVGWAIGQGSKGSLQFKVMGFHFVLMLPSSGVEGM